MNSLSQSKNLSAACGATPNRNQKEVHFVHLHAECLKDMKEAPFGQSWRTLFWLQEEKMINPIGMNYNVFKPNRYSKNDQNSNLLRSLKATKFKKRGVYGLWSIVYYRRHMISFYVNKILKVRNPGWNFSSSIKSSIKKLGCQKELIQS